MPLWQVFGSATVSLLDTRSVVMFIPPIVTFSVFSVQFPYWFPAFFACGFLFLRLLYSLFDFALLFHLLLLTNFLL